MRSKLRKVIKIALVIFALLIVLASSLAYLQYRELRKTLAVSISDKATAVIGQKVEIEDLSFGPFANIDLYNIRVRNPEGFAAGDLLRIKRISIRMKYRWLIKKVLYFDDITLYSPDLTILRDDQGRTNISNELTNFFKRRATLDYRIGEFKIKSGSLDFNQNRYLRSKDVSISLKDLASESGHKTVIQGDILLAQFNRIMVDGWAYLNNEPKKLSLSLSSESTSLVPLKELLGRYGVSTEKAKMTFSLNSEGDTGKGFSIRSEIGIEEAGFKFFKRDVRGILLSSRAFLNIRDNAITLENISLRSGKGTAATLQGKIRDLFIEPSYSAELRIGGLDLSEYNFVRGLRVSGFMTSDKIHIQGNFRKPIPEISGAVYLKDAALISRDDDIKKINASLKFESRKAVTVEAAATATLSKAQGYLLDKPADVRLLLTARGNPKGMSVTSSVNLSPIGTHVKGGKAVYFNSVAFNVDGVIRDKAFSGKNRIEMKDIIFADHHIPWFRGVSALEYRRNLLTAISPLIEGENFEMSAERVRIRLPESEKKEKKMTVEVEGMNASYPATEAGLKKTDLSAQLNTGCDSLSGDFRFLLGGIMFRGISAAAVTGNGRFDGKGFSVDIPRAEISRGSVQLSVTGRTGGGPFPAKIKAAAENIAMRAFSKVASRILGMPYDISGDLKSAVFEGTLYSDESLKGNATISAEKITLRNRESKRDVLKDLLFSGAAEFKGKDFDFSADASTGKVSTTIAGTIKDFLLKDMSAAVRLNLPVTKTADIRDSLWGVSPDSLLYAGLDGTISSDLSMYSSNKDRKVDGSLTFRGVSIRGENGEYSVGPINGVLPVAYSKIVGKRDMIDMPSFDRSEFHNLGRYYSQERSGEGYSRITVGSLHYGFRFLENIDLMVKQKGTVLNIGLFSGSIFGGRLNGTAVFDFSEGLGYRAGIILQGLSMAKLCEEIESIRGYISGKADGTAILKGAGTGISQVIGKADFWTYGTEGEKTKISKEFLQKMGGASMKSYLGDRPFDKGEMSLYLQDGFVIFRNLEISHRNVFGVTDLSIKVAPFNNRIAIDSLMWSITEAAQRAKKE